MVVGVTDGDTVKVLDAGKNEIKVRLAEIDAPERGQPFGTASRKHLASIVHGEAVRVESNEKDRYGRVLGRIWHGDMDVNAEMVRSGMAWVYTQYSTDPSFAVLEADAKAAKRGLWADASPIPPWEWRKEKRGKKHSKKNAW